MDHTILKNIIAEFEKRSGKKITDRDVIILMAGMIAGIDTYSKRPSDAVKLVDSIMETMKCLEKEYGS